MEREIRVEEEKIPAGSAGGAGFRCEEEGVRFRVITGSGFTLASPGREGAARGMAREGFVVMMAGLEGLKHGAKTARRGDPDGKQDVQGLQHEPQFTSWR